MGGGGAYGARRKSGSIRLHEEAFEIGFFLDGNKLALLDLHQGARDRILLIASRKHDRIVELGSVEEPVFHHKHLETLQGHFGAHNTQGGFLGDQIEVLCYCCVKSEKEGREGSEGGEAEPISQTKKGGFLSACDVPSALLTFS